ncbi:MAG: cysteine desulfurase family protein [Verrucomicrobiia bacterium]
MPEINGKKTQNNLINLDFLSAVPLLPEVRAAMLPYLSDNYGDPSSLHRLGLYAREAIDTARKNLAGLINADNPDHIYFTSDSTEAANWAIKGSVEALKRFGNHIIITSIEHSPVIESAKWLENQGFKITKIPVDSIGKINPESIKSALTDKTILIAVQLANTEIGVIQPIERISEIAAEFGVQLYIDADAAIGWHPIDIQRIAANVIITFSTQRFYGPKGCAVLYHSNKARLANLLHGGSQQSGKRPGNENVPAIIGAGKAAEISIARLHERISKASYIQNLLWSAIKSKIPHIKLNGPPLGADRLTNSLNISFEFIEGEGLVLRCDMKNLLISSGSVCSSRASKISHILQAIGVDYSLAIGSVLLSWGEEINKEDIPGAVEIIKDSVEKLRSMSASWQAYKSGKTSPITPEYAD